MDVSKEAVDAARVVLKLCTASLAPTENAEADCRKRTIGRIFIVGFFCCVFLLNLDEADQDRWCESKTDGAKADGC